MQGEWPPEFSLQAYSYSGQTLRLRDGALLMSIFCRMEIGARDRPNLAFFTSFVFRSTDDGQTWSPPIRCDSNNWGDPDKWFAAGNFSEIGLAETDDNVVVGYGRPGPWPYMWRVQSNDGGKTWEPAAFGAFPGYCSTLTGTASGALGRCTVFPT